MAKGMTEQQLEHSLLHELGCYYSPHGAGLTCAEWLAQVHRQLVLAASVPRR